MFQDNSGKIIKGLSLNSGLASGVPGTVSGMFYASEKFGTIDIKSLISPSINLAREGFVLSDFQANNLNKYEEKFSKNLEAKKIFTRPDGFTTAKANATATAASIALPPSSKTFIPISVAR